MMKTKLAALAGTLALTLLVSTTWSAKPTLGTLQPTGTWGVVPQNPGDLSCPPGTMEFRDEFTALDPTNPTLPDATTNQKIFKLPDPDTGPFEVTVTITVNSDESVNVNASGGWFHQITIKAGQAEIFYNYDLFGDPDPENPPALLNKVDLDTELNHRHIVSDDKERDSKSQQVSHIDFCLSPVELPPNTSLISDCVTADGCNPSGWQNNNFPAAIGVPDFNNETVTQAPVTAWTHNQTLTCGGVEGSISPFVTHDFRVDDDGKPIESKRGPLDLSELFDLTEFFDDSPAFMVMLPEEVVGSPCLALLKGTNSKEFVDFAKVVAGLDEPVFTVTQFADLVDGMFFDEDDSPDAPNRITAPLCQVGEVPGIGLGTDNCTEDLQFVAQASLQADEIEFHVEDIGGAFTSEVFNPSKTKSGKGTFYFLNTREVCLDVTFGPPINGTPYFEAVQQCKIDLAVRHFNNLEVLINEANDRGNLIAPSVQRLLNLHSKWLSMIKNAQWNKSDTRGKALRAAVVDGTWEIDDFNDPGHLIMLIDNLLYRTFELQLAEEFNEL